MPDNLQRLSIFEPSGDRLPTYGRRLAQQGVVCIGSKTLSVLAGWVVARVVRLASAARRSANMATGTALQLGVTF